MKDFDLNIYANLLDVIKVKGYNFFTFDLYKQINGKGVILRHDVDLLPENSARMAKLEASYGIKGTYNFRIVPESFNMKVITEIAALGHEIGYHYEEMDTVYKGKGQGAKGKVKEKDLVDEAYDLFCKNLSKIREIADVKTICMHGSPLSPFDNKAIWKKYDYRELGITGEPYFDMDFNEFAYLTDTGRRWNGESVSVRDKVDSKAWSNGSLSPMRHANKAGSGFKSPFRTTYDIINNIDKLPDKIMFTIHPQRWNDNLLMWTKELVLQNVKNVVKKVVVRKRAG